jgi:hypothetical protein
MMAQEQPCHPSRWLEFVRSAHLHHRIDYWMESAWWFDAAPHAPQQFVVQSFDLPPFPGGDFTQQIDTLKINDQGLVAGIAIRWVGPYPYERNAGATAFIDKDGVISESTLLSSQPYDALYPAPLDPSVQVAQGLSWDLTPTGESSSGAYLVGSAVTVARDGQYVATVGYVERNGTLAKLDPDANADMVWPQAVNDRGQVVGTYYEYDASGQYITLGFVYDEGHITTLAVPGAYRTSATGIADDR